MSDHTLEAQLAAMPLFAGLTSREIAEVAGSVIERVVKPGKSVIKEGNWGHEFVLVIEGDIDVVRDGEVVDTAGAGSYVGERAVLDDVRRNASVIARTPVLAGVIEGSLFLALLDQIPELAERVQAAFGRRTPPGTRLL